MAKKQAPKTSPTAKTAVGAPADKAAALTGTDTDEIAALPTETIVAHPPVPDAPASDETPEDGGTDPATETVKEILNAPTFGITERTVIVVAAPGVPAELLARAWSKAAAPADIRMVAPATTLAETVESLVADDLMPEEFIFVHGICFPVGMMTLADLTLYRARILENGSKRDFTGLPMHMTKTNIVEALRVFMAEPEQTDEIFVHAYNVIAHKGEIPNNASLHFGNAVTYATKSDLCTGRLVDALRQKKFICLNLEAFGTAKRYLEEYVKR